MSRLIQFRGVADTKRNQTAKAAAPPSSIPQPHYLPVSQILSMVLQALAKAAGESNRGLSIPPARGIPPASHLLPTKVTHPCTQREDTSCSRVCPIRLKDGADFNCGAPWQAPVLEPDPSLSLHGAGVQVPCWINLPSGFEVRRT